MKLSFPDLWLYSGYRRRRATAKLPQIIHKSLQKGQVKKCEEGKNEGMEWSSDDSSGDWIKWWQAYGTACSVVLLR